MDNFSPAVILANRIAMHAEEQFGLTPEHASALCDYAAECVKSGYHLLTQQEWEAMTAEVHNLKADNAALTAMLAETNGEPRQPFMGRAPDVAVALRYEADRIRPVVPVLANAHQALADRIIRTMNNTHPGASLLSEMADLRRQLAEAKREAAENADALAQAQAELQASRRVRVECAEAYGANINEANETNKALREERDAAQQRVRELEAKHAAAVGRARARYDVLDSLVRRTDPYDDGPCWCEHRRSHAEALHNRACRDARASMAWTGVDMEAAS